MKRRILGSLLVLGLALALAGCNDDDDGNEGVGGTTTVPGASEEQQENTNFCNELVEFGTQVAANLNLSTPEAMTEWAEEVAAQAREVAEAAPSEIEDAADELASESRNLADDIAEGNAEAAAEVNTRLNDAVSKMTTFAQENCPQASLPTTAPGGG